MLLQYNRILYQQDRIRLARIPDRTQRCSERAGDHQATTDADLGAALREATE